jgi:hypothetical protein
MSSTYTKGIDSKNQPYVELPVQEKTESVRITYVKDGYPNKPCIRIQIHPHGEKLRPGPEFSIEYTPLFVAALMDLVMSVQTEDGKWGVSNGPIGSS